MYLKSSETSSRKSLEARIVSLYPSNIQLEISQILWTNSSDGFPIGVEYIFVGKGIIEAQICRFKFGQENGRYGCITNSPIHENL